VVLAARIPQALCTEAYLAELILDHSDLHSMLFAQDVVQQRGLSRAKEPRQDRDGHTVVH
jgi:hypothetical protein